VIRFKLISLADSDVYQLYNIIPQIILRISKAIYRLGIDPRKGSVWPMVGSTSWRLRVGDYRVVYDTVNNKLVVLIIRIRNHKHVYRE
jgi:mRNA interferase RelE/StbE